MARKLRIHVPHGVYHVMLRGNNKQQIFFSDADRCHLSLILQESTIRFNCRIHAFCFMGNHVHLALQISDTPLSKIMHSVAFRFARWLNNQYGRVGHLFQGRYRAILVDHDEYLLTLIRYIHLNPVKAAIVNHPHEYYWSGHRTYLGIDNFPWLTTHWVLGFLSENSEIALANYQKLFSSCEESPEDIFLSQYPVSETVLGSREFKINTFQKEENFKSELICDKFTTKNIIEFIIKKHNIYESMLYTKMRHPQIMEARTEISYLCTQLCDCSRKEIATLLQCSPAYISRLIHTATHQQQEKIEEYKKELSKIYSI